MIAEKLEALERGDILRLILLCPPRHGKSELVSVNFPAWALGRDPSHHIMSGSYNVDLAKHFGRRTRDLIAGEDYNNVFPETHLSSAAKAADAWETKQRGIYRAFGIGGG